MNAEVTSPERKTFSLPLIREYMVTGKTTKMEKGHPRITPAAATETAKEYFPRRYRDDERVTAYIEKVLGRKPEKYRRTSKKSIRKDWSQLRAKKSKILEDQERQVLIERENS